MMMRLVLVLLVGVLWASNAWAQASGIAGVVRDSTGAVLPGVTVEAESPALIERVRVVYTDAQGRYNVVDLRPGTYAVTFTLPGFSVVRREGIALPVGFTATVDADLQVGSVEETVTVTGGSPLVDVRNVRQQTLVPTELRTELPSGSMNLMSLAALVPGMTQALDQGGGGAMGIYGSNQSTSSMYHGKGSTVDTFDGMQVNNLSGIGSVSYIMNPFAVEEASVQTGGISADAASGFIINMVPKSGGNRFSFSGSGMFTNSRFQGSNVDKLRDRGVQGDGQKTLHAYDVNATLGGPIKEDRIWFFAATRLMGTKNNVVDRFANATQGTPIYTPDFSRPHFNQDWLRSQAIRVTAQVSERHRVSGFADPQYFQTRGWQDNAAPEAQICWDMWPNGVFQGTWTATLTTRLLLEAGAGLAKGPFPCTLEQRTDLWGFTVGPNDISIQEATTGYVYNAPANTLVRNDNDRYAQRFALSYVTGSHSYRFGFDLQQHVNNRNTEVNQDMTWRFRNGIPEQITLRATPTWELNRTKADLGIYAQDQWALGRMTLNYGARFDYFNGYLPEQDVPAGRFVPERRFAPVHGVPNWKDLNPRLGLAYDLFGNGRTALRTSLGRYVGKEAVSVTQQFNPVLTSVNSTNRSWNDANRNFVPDCVLSNFAANGECGPIDNQNFGQLNPNARRFEDDLVRGFGNRDYFWDAAVEVHHEVRPGMSLVGGYYRNWSDHFRALPRGDFGTVYVVDNLLVTRADFDPFCITAPADRRLPGGGGYEVCGLYDLKPEKFGLSEEVASRPGKFGDQSRVSDFLTVAVNTRLGRGIEFGGSLDTGRTVEDRCFVVDSPQSLLNCRVVTPFGGQTQVKFHGVYPLPYGFRVSGTFQSLSGVGYLADYSASSAEVAASLGRPLSGGRRSVIVPLVAPQTLFEPRRSILDLRFSRIFDLPDGLRLQANLDVYNLLNDAAILNVNGNYGSGWRRPVVRGIAAPRLFQLSARVTF